MKVNLLYRCVTLGIIIAAGGNGTALAQTGNTGYGDSALSSNVDGFDNSAFGNSALSSNVHGYANTANGFGALLSNVAGYYNTASGAYSLNRNTDGAENTAIGAFALNGNKTASSNTAVGSLALWQNTYGNANSAFGRWALSLNTTGFKNSAFGSSALYFNTNGKFNAAVGYVALFSNTTGSNNTATGYNALASNTTGGNNIAVGALAGYYSNIGSNNIEIGNRGARTDDALIRVGTQGTQKATYVAGISGVNVSGGAAVVVNSQGQLGVVSSSRRYKEDIHSMGSTSERLLKLHPVTFRYKQPDENGQKPEQYGLIAEEVATVMPELVIYNDKGQPETVAYQTLTPLLLNELQREHSELVSMRTQRAEIDALRAEVAELRRLTGAPAVQRPSAGER